MHQTIKEVLWWHLFPALPRYRCIEFHGELLWGVLPSGMVGAPKPTQAAALDSGPRCLLLPGDALQPRAGRAPFTPDTSGRRSCRTADRQPQETFGPTARVKRDGFSIRPSVPSFCAPKRPATPPPCSGDFHGALPAAERAHCDGALVAFRLWPPGGLSLFFVCHPQKAPPQKPP